MTETTTNVASHGLTSADSGEPTGARTPADALGEPKRMSTSESEGQESHECPTCGRDDFQTTGGMKNHHAQIHGESIAGVERTCEHCGDTFRTNPAYVDRGDGQYCSRSCKGKGCTDGDTVKRECEWCGDNFSARKARVDRGDARFCSQDCYGEWQADTQSVERECQECGSQFTIPQSQLKYRPANFCSLACAGEKLSRTRLAEDHPNWKGGHEPYYGPSWRTQRRRALDRDGSECQVCGRDDEVHVHHIRPFRKFGVENHEQANELENLICLCPKHHAKWEGIPLRPEVV